MKEIQGAKRGEGKRKREEKEKLLKVSFKKKNTTLYELKECQNTFYMLKLITKIN